MGIKIALLTSTIKKSAKQQLYADLQAGEIDLVIGTHALIQSDVVFANLQLAIIDEQHRFGVLQRQALAEKAHLKPHLLSMTATPIPRSLALVLKNELKIISIRHKPATRRPIRTTIIPKSKQALMFDDVRAQLDQGRQGYVICNLIEANDESSRQSVEATFQVLAKGELKNYRLATLHGKLKPDEKEAIMRQFADGQFDVLIAMVIQDAENYGLSQLHQLRGRIGRGDHQSYCYLLSGGSAEDNQRLTEIEKSDDGFYLAEVDLNMRGMGDLFGRSQHGWFDLDANLEAIEASAQACEIYRQDVASRGQTMRDDLQKYPELWQQISQFDNLTILN